MRYKKRTSGNSSKFLVSSIEVTFTGKAAGRSLDAKELLKLMTKTEFYFPMVCKKSVELKCSPDMFPIHCVEPGELLHIVQARDPD